MKDILKKILIFQDKKGLALVLAMFVLVFIAILIVAFLELITSDLQITSNHLGRLQAIYIADAGIEYAVSRLRTSVNWSVVSETTTFPAGSGSFYTVTYPETGTTRVIRSVGNKDNKFTASIEARVSIKQGSPNIIKIVNWKEI